MRLPDFEAWAIFAAVADARSFTGAARALGLSKATVSKAVARLEAHTGTPLLNRTSRRLALTETGVTLAERAHGIVAAAEEAEEAARDEAASPSGAVRVAAPLSFGVSHVAPAIADFMAAHPGLVVDLWLSDERIDIVGGGFDLAVRIGALADSSLRARTLRAVDAPVVAAPSFLAKHGVPAHPSDLNDLPCICYSLLPTPDSWLFVGMDGEQVRVRPNGPFRVNNGEAMLPALRAGLGIGFLPDFIIADDLAAGTLVPILPGWKRPDIGLHLVFAPSRVRTRRVTMIADWLAARL